MTAPPRASAAAIVMWAAAWGLVAASAAIGWVTGFPPAPLPQVFLTEAPREIHRLAYPLDVTVALVYGPASALILARRPHPVGIALAAYAVGSGLAAFGIQYGMLGARIEGLPLWGLLAYAGGWAFVPGTFLAAAVPILVTRARLPRWQRGVVALAVAAAAAATLISLTNQGAGEPRNPLGIDVPGYQAALPSLYTALSGLALAISLVSCGVVVARWRRARRRRARFGLAWLALGQFVVTLAYIAQALPASLDTPDWMIDVALLMPIVGQLLFPAGIIVVVLGERLWGAELVVSRVLLWALLSVSGVALYLAVVAIVPATLGASGPLAFVVPVIIALAVLPLRGWLQRRIDRLIYGEGADAGALLARLGERIGELPPGDAGIEELADEVSARPFEPDELAGALTRLAHRFTWPGLLVAVDATDTSRLPPDVAETLYFIAAEAVANAARHAAAREIRVRIRASATEAELEVTDDGTGIAADAEPGVGMASMRERAHARGGECTVSTGPAGTTVRARIGLVTGNATARPAWEPAAETRPSRAHSGTRNPDAWDAGTRTIGADGRPPGRDTDATPRDRRASKGTP